MLHIWLSGTPKQDNAQLDFMNLTLKLSLTKVLTIQEAKAPAKYYASWVQTLLSASSIHNLDLHS